MLFSPHLNGLHAINKCEQVPYSTWFHKFSLVLGKSHKQHLQTCIYQMHMVYLFLATLVQMRYP